MNISSIFVEKRLQRTGKKFFDAMVSSKTSSIRGFSEDRNEQRRFYRWIHHKEITKERLINTSIKRTASLVKGRHVLAIQDTTELNYQAHANRVRGLGTVGNGNDAGIFLHPLLVIDAKTYQGLGLGAIHIWNRFKKKDEQYQRLPIEEKESYRWLLTAEAGKEHLSEAASITFVGDRENDIYEFLDRIPGSHHYILTRSRCDRKLFDGTLLYERLEKTSISKRVKLALPKSNKRAKMTVTADLRFKAIEIKKPRNLSDKTASERVKLWVVQVKETSDRKEAIDWTLLTTHEVNTMKDAAQMVDWYKQRWQIEQLFRTLKSQGLDIESSQLETEASLTKLVIVALNAAINIMQLVLARAGNTAHQTKMMFTADEIECLKVLQLKLEGKTKKQKNPHPPDNLAWASWIIGRLGGWMGHQSDGLVGPIVMGRGLERFYRTFDGFILSRNMGSE